ncbi:MAG TPA: hypothetical protein VGK97_02420, partial [Spongiibacteraceae bacterium]
EEPKNKISAPPPMPHQQLLEQLRTNESVLPPPQNRVELFSMYNREAPVPPQCYTRTEGRHNPCYVCHQNAIPGRENTMNDFHLQREYAFSEIGSANHWINLLEDRTRRVAAIGDDDILQWIAQDNYSELAPRLQAANFQGWIPDLNNLQLGAAAFDAEGFAKDGSQWVTFNYKPLPSTFWPTNGSTDDVMIRLPVEFRSDANGHYSRAIYQANLALLEAAIKTVAEIDTPPLDEKAIGVDLDGNRKLGIATHVKRRDHFVGGAKNIAITPTIYPQGTEFLHTVRYLGIAADGGIYNSARMKEVRYMRRWLESTPAQLQVWYDAENAEKDKGELPAYRNMGHRGLATPMGWQLSAFIEDKNGRLRFNTFEETMYCMGCHNSIGSTIDKTFAFARKIDGAKGWGYINLHGMPDAPNVGEIAGEIATYLERSGGGSEFRSNTEMEKRFYYADGSLNQQAIAAAHDVYELITPSRERALQLNKAYRVIVADQTYLYGRDATVTPPKNVYMRIDETAPALRIQKQYAWDIRLDWKNTKTPRDNSICRAQ